MKKQALKMVKTCITNLLDMGPMGPKGLGPWATMQLGVVMEQLQFS